MTRTRYRPTILVLGLCVGLLVSASACALMTRAATAAAGAGVRQAVQPDRDPFVPLAEVPGPVR